MVQYFTAKHSIRKDTNSYYTIDGVIPPSGGCVIPETEISSTTLKMNEKSYAFPKKAFSHLYNPNLTKTVSIWRPIEVRIDGAKLYIYISGGNAAESYLSKIVFDENQYITTMVADYGDLMGFGAFTPWFAGF